MRLVGSRASVPDDDGAGADADDCDDAAARRKIGSERDDNWGDDDETMRFTGGLKRGGPEKMSTGPASDDDAAVPPSPDFRWLLSEADSSNVTADEDFTTGALESLLTLLSGRAQPSPLPRETEEAPAEAPSIPPSRGSDSATVGDMSSAGRFNPRGEPLGDLASLDGNELARFTPPLVTNGDDVGVSVLSSASVIQTQLERAEVMTPRAPAITTGKSAPGIASNRAADAAVGEDTPLDS
jgi:hypothetical protein